MWMLVFINVIFTLPSEYDEPHIDSWWEFESMEECFLARDLILADMGAYKGIPPKGTQLVCINYDKSVDREEKRDSGILEYRF